eukprot:GHVO01045522.1.p1 GENE.GHVO01045522.1~~GHVO01045522.1.p1  ORF type:complete len:114 (-),score=9.58 GHVO01045522.1:58-399(-)
MMRVCSPPELRIEVVSRFLDEDVVEVWSQCVSTEYDDKVDMAMLRWFPVSAAPIRIKKQLLADEAKSESVVEAVRLVQGRLRLLKRVIRRHTSARRPRLEKRRWHCTTLAQAT